MASHWRTAMNRRFCRPVRLGVRVDFLQPREEAGFIADFGGCGNDRDDGPANRAGLRCADGIRECAAPASCGPPGCFRGARRENEDFRGAKLSGFRRPLRDSSNRISGVPRVPISPAVRSMIPVLYPASAMRRSVPPQVCSTSSGCAAMASRSTIWSTSRHRAEGNSARAFPSDCTRIMPVMKPPMCANHATPVSVTWVCAMEPYPLNSCSHEPVNQNEGRREYRPWW